MDLSERGSAAARHPWEIERFRAYRRVLADHGVLGARRVLDVGAGDGWFAEQLLDDLPAVDEVVCWDINYSELELTTDDARLVRTTIRPDGPFDLVLVLDVLEHVVDAASFVRDELARVTSPGTAVLVAVPAHQWLFGDHDRALGHERRYSPARLRTEVAGWLDVEDSGSLFATLVAPRAASVALERLRARRTAAADDGAGRTGEHGVGHWSGGPLLTSVVRSVLAADARTARALGPFGRRLPGLSTWVFGRTR